MSDINSILVEGVPNEPVVEMVSAEPSVLTAAPVLAAAVAAVATPVPAFVAPSGVSLPSPALIPATPTEQVLSLSGEVAKTLHDLLTYIHEGFDQHSIMIGMSRLCEIARLVKAEVEA